MMTQCAKLILANRSKTAIENRNIHKHRDTMKTGCNSCHWCHKTKQLHKTANVYTHRETMHDRLQ